MTFEYRLWKPEGLGLVFYKLQMTTNTTNTTRLLYTQHSYQSHSQKKDTSYDTKRCKDSSIILEGRLGSGGKLKHTQIHIMS